MKKASKLSNSERCEIQILHERGYANRQIATVLGRSPNTIGDEIARNSSSGGQYNAQRAQHKAYVRRQYATYQGKKIQENDKLRHYIITGLQAGWNPDEISGVMKRTAQSFYASKTTIYDWLYSEWGQEYCQYLPSKQYRPKKCKQPALTRVMIPDRRSITERPPEVTARTQPGHWEYDSVVSSKRSGSTAALAVASERTTRLVTATLVPNLKPTPFAITIAEQLTGLYVATLTTDNGIENKHHTVLSQKTGAPVFFTDPYCSWQKGGVENANKMLRRYYPKGTDFARVRQTDVVYALTRINNKPRKILGYISSLQLAKKKGVILEKGVLIGG